MPGITKHHQGRELSGPHSAPWWRHWRYEMRRLCGRADASTIALGIMWLFIAAVSSADVYCSIKYEFELLAEEMNPLGRWLMQLDGGSVGLFMACKFFCNLLAVSALHVLYALHRPLCLAAAGVMTVVQGCLAIILWI